MTLFVKFAQLTYQDCITFNQSAQIAVDPDLIVLPVRLEFPPSLVGCLLQRIFPVFDKSQKAIAGVSSNLKRTERLFVKKLFYVVKLFAGVNFMKFLDTHPEFTSVLHHFFPARAVRSVIKGIQKRHQSWLSAFDFRHLGEVRSSDTQHIATKTQLQYLQMAPFLLNVALTHLIDSQISSTYSKDTGYERLKIINPATPAHLLAFVDRNANQQDDKEDTKKIEKAGKLIAIFVSVLSQFFAPVMSFSRQSIMVTEFAEVAQ